MTLDSKPTCGGETLIPLAGSDEQLVRGLVTIDTGRYTGTAFKKKLMTHEREVSSSLI